MDVTGCVVTVYYLTGFSDSIAIGLSGVYGLGMAVGSGFDTGCDFGNTKGF